MRAQRDINIKNMQETQELNLQNMEETMRIQREEAQRAQRLQTETQFIGAHGLDQQAAVLKAGPFTTPQLTQLVQNGNLTPQTLVWKQGMPSWAAASALPELAALFAPPGAPVPPPMPPTF